MDEYQYQAWPAWRYGPKGESGQFEKASDVPIGWKNHPDDHAKASIEKVAKAAQAPVKEKPASEPKNPAATDHDPEAQSRGSEAEVDESGTPFNPDLHAATRTKTSAGLWRMKVGVKRPEPTAKLDL